jgi:hypothetical protein
MPLPIHPPPGGKTLIILATLSDLDKDALVDPSVALCPIGEAYENPQVLASVSRVIICTRFLSKGRVPDLIRHLEANGIVPEAIQLVASVEAIQKQAQRENRLNPPIAPGKKEEGKKPTVIQIVADNWQRTGGDKGQLLALVREYYPDAPERVVPDAKHSIRKLRKCGGRSPEGVPEVPPTRS